MEALLLMMPLLVAQAHERWGDRLRIRGAFQLFGGMNGKFCSFDYESHQHCALYRLGFWLGTWTHSPLWELRKKA